MTRVLLIYKIFNQGFLHDSKRADNNLLISQHFLMVDEESEAQDHLRLLARAILIIGSNEDHIWMVGNCHRCCQYLARPNLHLNPRVDQNSKE